MIAVQTHDKQDGKFQLWGTSKPFEHSFKSRLFKQES
jgi:hypothetical protein